MSRRPVHAKPLQGAVDDSADLRAVVEAACRTVIDPELGLDIVDLGLVYAIGITGSSVDIGLGVTTPSCPYGHRLAEQTAAAVGALPGVDEVHVSLILDPPWSPALLSERARRLLGWEG